MRAERADEELRAKAPTPDSDPAHPKSFGRGWSLRSALGRTAETYGSLIFRVEPTQYALQPGAIERAGDDPKRSGTDRNEP
jgi:hypothetical protein